jgi:hypothetical protein
MLTGLMAKEIDEQEEIHAHKVQGMVYAGAKDRGVYFLLGIDEAGGRVADRLLYQTTRFRSTEMNQMPAAARTMVSMVR